jgi:hypothetical protein
MWCLYQSTTCSNHSILSLTSFLCLLFIFLLFFFVSSSFRSSVRYVHCLFNNLFVIYAFNIHISFLSHKLWEAVSIVSFFSHSVFHTSGRTSCTYECQYTVFDYKLLFYLINEKKNRKFVCVNEKSDLYHGKSL